MTEQIYTETTKNGLLPKVREMKADGFVLSQISVTVLEDFFDILYSFEKQYELVNLRLNIDKEVDIESVSSVYTYAYLYENEIKDLFGIKVNNINLDFKGNLYKIAQNTPFNPVSDTDK